MDPAQNAIFSLAERRLNWLADRQVILARNIANLDTPGFMPQDQPDFAASLLQTAGVLTRTNPAHLASASSPQAQQKPSPSRSPDGNAVTLEDQLVKVADTDTSQKITTAIYQEYLNMFSLALGHTSG